MGGGVPVTGLVSLEEEEEEEEIRALSLHLSTGREHSKKAATCKPEEGPHRTPDQAGTLACPTSTTVRNQRLLCKPPSLRCFVTTVQDD